MGDATPRWADILEMATEAEAMGFDAVWISDHVGFGDPDGEWSGAWDSWTLLSALGAATSRVRLGTYVSAVPYRNPALFAKMAETLDEISGGRVILGLGAGWNEPEFRAYNFPFEHRFDRFEDALRIITAMLRTGRADHEGRYEHARGALIRPRGPRPDGLPVMVGANGPRMLRLTAELADQWNIGMPTSDEELVEGLRDIDAACAAVGRDPETLVRSSELLVHTDKGLDPEAVAARLRRWAGLGVAHAQIQVRPNSIAGVRAFRPVVDALMAS
jgi:probable F420-dependent oxidoreductase